MRDTDSAADERGRGSDEDGRDGDAGGPATAPDSSGERWLPGDRILEAALPADIGLALGRLLGEDPVETLGDWVTAVRQHTGGGAITAGELCHADTRSPHRGVLDGETYGFRCFYDAVILAALVDEPVDVRTESPDGTVVEATAAGTDDLTVEPPGAVFSFGVDQTVAPPADGEPSSATVYAAVCPYVRAFPDASSYESWANTVPAATVAMPLAGATDVAAALVE